MKVIFFEIILFVLNLTSAVASKVCCLGCNLNLFVLPVYPNTTMRTVCPGDIVVGKDGSQISSVSEHSWYLNSIDITEQFFEPALLTNKSNIGLSELLNGGILQFCASNICGLALGEKSDFISATIGILTDRNANKPTKTDQINSNIEIYSKYIFYKWAYFILAFSIIIREIIRQIKEK